MRGRSGRFLEGFAFEVNAIPERRAAPKIKDRELPEMAGAEDGRKASFRQAVEWHLRPALFQSPLPMLRDQCAQASARLISHANDDGQGPQLQDIEKKRAAGFQHRKKFVAQ